MFVSIMGLTPSVLDQEVARLIGKLGQKQVRCIQVVAMPGHPARRAQQPFRLDVVNGKPKTDRPGTRSALGLYDMERLPGRIQVEPRLVRASPDDPLGTPTQVIESNFYGRVILAHAIDEAGEIIKPPLLRDATPDGHQAEPQAEQCKPG
jgi:hypothetical protein